MAKREKKEKEPVFFGTSMSRSNTEVEKLDFVLALIADLGQHIKDIDAEIAKLDEKRVELVNDKEKIKHALSTLTAK